MTTPAPQAVKLADYRPSPYSIDTVDLQISLDPVATRVRSRLAIRPNPASSETGAPLVLDGESIALCTILLDGTPLAADAYVVSQRSLSI
ncbi:MAG: aminopeptidase N, partial [Aestuariivirga sp.]